MRRIITIFFILISAITINKIHSQTFENESLENLIFGKWVLSKNPKFMVIFTKDSLIYLYDKKVTDKQRISYAFNDDCKKYLQKNGAYNFTKDGGLNWDFFFQEYNKDGDTLTSHILYVDNNSIELGLENGSITYKRLNTKKKSVKRK
jgi:hypothetical protein